MWQRLTDWLWLMRWGLWREEIKIPGGDSATVIKTRAPLTHQTAERVRRLIAAGRVRSSRSTPVHWLIQPQRDSQPAPRLRDDLPPPGEENWIRW